MSLYLCDAYFYFVGQCFFYFFLLLILPFFLLIYFFINVILAVYPSAFFSSCWIYSTGGSWCLTSIRVQINPTTETKLSYLTLWSYNKKPKSQTCFINNILYRNVNRFTVNLIIINISFAIFWYMLVCI